MLTITKYKTLLCILCFSCITLIGCGFKLRGQNSLPSALHIIYLKSDSPYSSFTSQLKQVLLSSKIRIVTTASEAPVTLHIMNTQYTHTAPDSGSNEARIFTFNYKVTFAIVSKAGNNLLGPETISVTRNLILNAGQVLSNNNQAAQLQQQMEQDAIWQLFNRLSAKQTFDVLTHANENNNRNNKP